MSSQINNTTEGWVGQSVLMSGMLSYCLNCEVEDPGIGDSVCFKTLDNFLPDCTVLHSSVW